MQLLRRHRLSVAGLQARQLGPKQAVPVPEPPATIEPPTKAADPHQPSYVAKYDAWKQALWHIC